MRSSRRDAIRLGHVVARGSEHHGFHRFFVATATAALVLATVAMAAAVAQYAGAATRGAERTPRDVGYFVDETPALLWTNDHHLLDGGRQAGVVVIAALGDQPPLPPGVAVWPKPGEIVVSPGWEAHADELPAAYADLDVVGRIAPPGLVDNGEILAYVGADTEALTIAGATRASGFGASYVRSTGTELYRQPVVNLVGVIAATGLLPAGFLLISALRVGAGPRSRRDELLASLGASRGFAAAVRWGEVRPAIVVGTGVAAVVLALALLVDLPVPGVGYSLRAADNRDHLALLVGAFLAATLLSVALAQTRVGLHAERPRRGAARSQDALVDAVLAPFVAAATIIVLNLRSLHAIGTVVLPLFVLGIIATTALLPRSTRAWLTLSARRDQRRGWEDGDAARLVAGRQIAARPRPYGRIGGVAAAGIVLLCLAVRFVTIVGEDGAEAASYLRDGGHVVGRVGLPFQTRDDGDPGRLLAAAQEAVIGDHYVLGVRFDSEAWVTTVIGDAASLEGMGLVPGRGPSTIEAVDYALGWALDADTVAELGEITADTADSLVVMRRDGAEIDRADVDARLAPVTMPLVRVEFPGESWVRGAAVNEHQARWLVVGGMWAMALLTAALWAGYSNELVRMRQGLLPAQVLAPDTGLTRAATFRRIVPPIALSAVVGMLTGLLLSLPLYNVWLGFGALPWRSAISGAVIVTASGLVAWLVMSHDIAARSISLSFRQSGE